jgi:hypothetical protein
MSRALVGRAIDGAMMSAGIDRMVWGRFGFHGTAVPEGSEGKRARFSKVKLAVVPLALLVAAAVWIAMSGSRGGVSQPQSAQPVAAAPTAQTYAAPSETGYDPLTTEAIIPEQPTPMDRLKLSSQSWRRGGLGSNALVSFTVRNNNDYAIRDVEISCAFARRDGGHLTDRTRLVPGIIETRSRKTFAHVHIGFVNPNANRAKCALVSASRT